MSDKTSFQDALNRLQDSKKDIPSGHLRFYSDLDGNSLRLFLDTWRGTPLTRQLTLLDRLLSHLDTDTLVNYEAVGRALLNDPSAEVRARAVRLLTEARDPRLIEPFREILQNDFDLDPRIEAATLLGEFILHGELEKLPEATQRQIEDALIAVINHKDHPTLRQRALESLGYSSHPKVFALIEEAFQRADPAWVASALCAMGRSHDDERWNDDVVSMLLHDDPRIRFEAVKAAGELEIKTATSVILQMLEDDEEDDEVAAAAVWTLSQIGGEDARVYLVALIEQTEDEDALEFLEGALENLDFNEEMSKFDLLALDKDDE